MLINLTEYFDTAGKKAEIEVPYEPDTFNTEWASYPILKKDTCKFSIVSIGDAKLQISGNGEFILQSACDRCLTEVDVNVPISFEYTVVKPDGYHEIDEDEQFFMNGYELDTKALINNELIMSLPMKVLCKDTCKGLCPVCGKNRNEGDCGCDTFVPDPRLAAISDIFNANKEV